MKASLEYDTLVLLLTISLWLGRNKRYDGNYILIYASFFYWPKCLVVKTGDEAELSPTSDDTLASFNYLALFPRRTIFKVNIPRPVDLILFIIIRGKEVWIIYNSLKLIFI